MKYILLIYDDEKNRSKMSDAERKQLFSDYGQFTEQIKASGHYVTGAPLQSVSTATSVRVRDGKQLVIDGPFAETREQLGGYYLIEAKNLDAATGIAARVPSARMGTIEVRPLMEMAVPASA